MAAWFVEQGFTSIALISRREPSTEEKQKIERMKRGTANIHVFVADVGGVFMPIEIQRALEKTNDLLDFGQISKVIQTISTERSLSPLIGVVHSVLVLKDELLRDASVENHLSVLRPRMYLTTKKIKK